MKLKMTVTRFVLLAVLPAMAAPAAVAGKLDAETAGSGLKEALRVGTERAVDLLGRTDGYLGNPDVRIPLPKNMQRIAKGLRAVGLDGTVDEFETSMNRAAEAAAPLAKEVFVGTIKEMSFSDASKIVRGKGHEATDYLREHAGPRLAELFRPIVNEQLGAVGATRSFDELMASTEKLPFVRKPAIDLEQYVTDKALDGMFFSIAREEEKIRKDPLARTTDLLKTVFGGGSDDTKKKPWWKRLGG